MDLEQDKVKFNCLDRISTYSSRIVWFSCVQTKKCFFGFRNNTSTFFIMRWYNMEA